VSLAIDDFGTGCASRGGRRAFPVDWPKVDRWFVQHMTRSGDRAIAEVISAMSQILRLGVVAAAVADFASLLRRRELKCRVAQGSLPSRPLPGTVARRCLRRLGEPFDGTRTQRLLQLSRGGPAGLAARAPRRHR
jgi:EAL domain-containing protein (putative c-di-GMP-specific phosphodiesterase class I)